MPLIFNPLHILGTSGIPYIYEMCNFCKKIPHNTNENVTKIRVSYPNNRNRASQAGKIC